MSSTDNHDEHGSDDQIDFFKVIMVGLISLVVFAAGTIWAVAIFRRESARAQATSGPTHQPVLGQSEVGIVDQVLFEGDHRLADWRAERKARLDGYGWMDRSKGVAHIPIDKAIDEVVSGALPEGAPK